MIKVLFVCLGNICRSPLAEAIFAHKVAKRGLSEHFQIDSAGTSNYHVGDPPDPRTIMVASKNRVPINSLGRQFKRKDFDQFDYILAMDRSNHHNLLMLVSGSVDNLHLMRDFDPKEPGAEVPDPYYGGEDGFDLVYDILERSTEKFLDHVIQEHKLDAG